jgi:hypothetical protein
MTALITTTPTRTTTKVLSAMLIGLIILVGISLLMVSLHAAGNWSGGLMLGNNDVSDSLIGWMIAIPVIVITMALVTLIMIGVGIILAAVVAMILVIALVAVVFGLVMAVLPIAAFVAVPVLIVWGIVKLLTNNARLKQQYGSQTAI